LLIVSLVLVALAALAGTAFAQAATPTATPATLPTTGGTDSGNTVAIVLLALGATAGLGGLLLRGLRRPV
jgi:hypothetical protein